MEREYIKEWDFLHRHVDDPAHSPTVCPKAKGSDFKGCKGFSTESTCPTATAEYKYIYNSYSGFGLRCIRQ